MVSLSINTEKLKVKYILGIHSDLPNYPDPEDLMYFLIQWAISSSKSNEEITFNDSFICKKFDKNREEVKEILAVLIVNKWIKHVKDTDIKSVYAVIANPFS